MQKIQVGMNIELLGAQMKLARKRQGLSLKSLSEKTGVHYTQISRMERGAGVLVSKNVRKICTFLQISLDSPSADPASKEDLLRQVQRIMQAWPESEQLMRSVVDALESALLMGKADHLGLKGV